MKTSLAWLRAVAPSLDGADAGGVAERLASRGAPVEGIEALAEGLEEIVVARVETVEPHPDADRLTVCGVVAGEAGDVGDGTGPIQVVCGAPNVTAGGLYPLAPVGSTLPGGMAVGEVELRGVVSRGMLCSAKELDLSHDHGGLMELPPGLEPGTPLVEALGLRDWRLDVEITANRGDLLSHVGVAREAAPGGEADLVLPEIPGAPELAYGLVEGAERATGGGATIRIEDPELCHRYLGAVVRGVEVGPSPAWLQQRLRAAGSRPVNNVVDATNYVLLELGQPLHAFDLATLAGGTIVVRRAGEGEKAFTTLDGEKRRITPDMLMICDAERPVALAGVMGGRDSEVGDDTTDVLLECALFAPAGIRETRRSLNMSTDASYRFERGVDPAGMETAVARAVAIILATAGGRLEPEVADCRPRPWTPLEVELRTARVEQVLGVPFTADRIEELLAPLGFRVVERRADPEGLVVRVPGWRSYDVTREADLVEEVARTHGYDAFPAELGAFRPTTVPDHPLFHLEDDLRDLFVSRGFFEAQTPAFVPAAEGDVRVHNPVSKEEDHLRREILPSLVRRVEHNWSRGVGDVRLFELATSFSAPAEEGGAPGEEPRLAAVLTGRRNPVHWSGEDEAMDLWDVKGIVEAVAGVVRGRGRAVTLREGAPEGKGLIPGDGFTVLDGDGRPVGWAGRLSADAADAPAWADHLFGLEISLPPEPAPSPTPVFTPLPPFPGVERDLALLVPESVPAERVRRSIVDAGGEHLVDVSIFDRYVGEGVPEGVRSLAYRMRFRSPERTLTDDEVDRATGKIMEQVREAFGVEPRG